MKNLFENWRRYMSEAKDSDSVSKAVIIKEDGALLLLRSAEEKFPHKWDLPGGHLKEGEKFLQHFYLGSYFEENSIVNRS